MDIESARKQKQTEGDNDEIAMIEEKQLGQAHQTEAYQRHHDYYARLNAENKLADPDDQTNWRVAQQREHEGKVKPWTPEPPKGRPSK